MMEISIHQEQVRRYKECTKIEKCTKQLVRIVNKNVKYHLNHLEIGQFTVGNAIKNTNLPEEIGTSFNKSFKGIRSIP
jgi:hypothetical protein